MDEQPIPAPERSTAKMPEETPECQCLQTFIKECTETFKKPMAPGPSAEVTPRKTEDLMSPQVLTKLNELAVKFDEFSWNLEAVKEMQAMLSSEPPAGKTPRKAADSMLPQTLTRLDELAVKFEELSGNLRVITEMQAHLSCRLSTDSPPATTTDAPIGKLSTQLEELSVKIEGIEKMCPKVKCPGLPSEALEALS